MRTGCDTARQAMAVERGWQELFENWPASMRRVGVLVTSFGEQVPFQGFLTTGSFLLVERKAPDTVGTRQLIVPYCDVLGLKIVDPVDAANFRAMGFADGKTSSGDGPPRTPGHRAGAGAK